MRFPHCSPLAFALLVLALSGPAHAEPDASVEVLTTHALGDAYNFWGVHNFVSQDLFADPQRRAKLKETFPTMRDANCVRLIGGRSDGLNEFYRGLDANGDVQADFTELIRYIQGILDGGYTPRLVLDNVPNAMTSNLEFDTYGNTSPPDDYHVFHEYVQMLTQALVEAFGYREVSQWRFRVGTEPDLYPGHWKGTKEEYLKLYDFAAHAVTSVIPEADIGPGNILNPTDFRAGRPPRWGLDIIDHAATGTNYYTGGQGAPMRHFSISWYDRVGERGGVENLDRAMAIVRRRLDKFPQFSGMPIEIAEFMILSDVNGKRLWSGDVSEWQASWFAAVTDRVYDHDIPLVHLWDTTSLGVPHPKTHVIEFLEKLEGGQRVEAAVRTNNRAEGVGAIAARKNEAIYIILYNHDPRPTVDETHTVSLTIRDPRVADNQWQVEEWRVDRDHGVYIRQFIEDCQANDVEILETSGQFDGSIGRLAGPEGVELFKTNRDKYLEISEQPHLGSRQIQAEDKHLTLEIDLPVHSVHMLRLTPAK